VAEKENSAGGAQFPVQRGALGVTAPRRGGALHPGPTQQRAPIQQHHGAPIIQHHVAPVQHQAGPRMRMPVAQSAGVVQHRGGGGNSSSSSNYPPHNVRQLAPPAEPSRGGQGVGGAVGYAGPAPVVGGALSCPFCALTFIDSPALYEHLSMNHTVSGGG
jgi:hypothetical protein